MSDLNRRCGGSSPGSVTDSTARAARLMRMAFVRNFSKKARYDIGDRHEDKEPKRRERAEERDSRSQSLDDERDDVLSGMKPGVLKRLGFRPPLG
jgi:hypothetical protein